MVQLSELVGDAGVVALVDPGVLRDIVTSLSGSWDPDGEPDAARRSELVAAARLRLYADHERGWALVTTRHARETVERAAAGAPGDDGEVLEWSAGFVPALDAADDAVVPAEVEALATLYRDDDGLDAEAADTLAVAVMCPSVGYLVTRDPTAFKHRREHDLRETLHIVDALGAVNHLMLAPGEAPVVGPPPTTGLTEGRHWWVP